MPDKAAGSSRYGHRLSQALYSVATTLTGLLFVVSQGMSLPVGALFLVVAVGFDLSRAPLRGLGLPRHVYLPPTSMFPFIAVFVAVFTIAYLALPDFCSASLNRWAESHVSVIEWRMHELAHDCSVPHRGVITVLQLVLPLFHVVVLGILVTSARNSPSQFLDETPGWLRVRADRKSRSVNPITISVSLVIYWLFVTFMSSMPFDPTMTTWERSVTPQENVVGLFTYLFMWVIPLVILHFSIQLDCMTYTKENVDA